MTKLLNNVVFKAFLLYVFVFIVQVDAAFLAVANIATGFIWHCVVIPSD